jgi:RimJ/RimL family protein N-acetyltransferase
MRHDLRIDGYGFRLRPVCDSDAPFIVRLRSDTTLNRFIHASSPRLDDQLEWLAKYYDRPGDYYFAVEALAGGASEGVVSLYDIHPRESCAEWGRWILDHGSLAAVESAWLTYRVAFEQVGLQEVYCRTVTDNASVVSFHDSCGITDRRLLPGFFELAGQRLDAIEHRVHRTEWAVIAPRMARLAQFTAQRLSRG